MSGSGIRGINWTRAIARCDSAGSAWGGEIGTATANAVRTIVNARLFTPAARLPAWDFGGLTMGSRPAVGGLVDQPEETSEVLGLVEHFHPRIAAVNGMVPDPADRGSGSSRRASRSPLPAPRVKKAEYLFCVRYLDDESSSCSRKQHFLYFFPLPQGHGLLRRGVGVLVIDLAGRSQSPRIR